MPAWYSGNGVVHINFVGPS